MSRQEHELLLIAAYRDLANARTDFGELDRRAEKHAEMRAAVMAIKSEDGQPELIEAYNRHGGMGVAAGAGMGLLFGLLAGPVGISLLVGAAAGGLVASFADHELRSGLKHEVAEALEAGTAVIVAWVFPSGIEAIETAFESADSLKELPIDKQTLTTLEEAIADAMAEAGHPPVDVTAGATGTSS